MLSSIGMKHTTKNSRRAFVLGLVTLILILFVVSLGPFWVKEWQAKRECAKKYPLGASDAPNIQICVFDKTVKFD